MSISSIGDGLTVHISCEPKLHHDWMSFLCWYSLSKNLPEAIVVVTTLRQNNLFDLFGWARLLHIPILHHRGMSIPEQQQMLRQHRRVQVAGPILTISPEYACVRDFEESGIDLRLFDRKTNHIFTETPELSCNCKQENTSVFVNYPEGWGNFVTNAWLNKTSTPLITGVGLTKAGMTVNEARIGSLWEGAARLYQTVPRG